MIFDAMFWAERAHACMPALDTDMAEVITGSDYKVKSFKERMVFSNI
jgi:hypothetical protein